MLENFVEVCLLDGNDHDSQRSFVALPLDVRKGSAFSERVSKKVWGYAPIARQSLALKYARDRKGGAFPHIRRRSRKMTSPSRSSSEALPTAFRPLRRARQSSDPARKQS